MNTFLSFLRLVDENAQLSLTNVSVYGTLANFFTHRDLASALAFAASLIGYGYKRYVVSKTPVVVNPETAVVDALKAELNEQKNKLSSLAIAVGMKSTPLRRP